MKSKMAGKKILIRLLMASIEVILLISDGRMWLSFRLINGNRLLTLPDIIILNKNIVVGKWIQN